MSQQSVASTLLYMVGVVVGLTLFSIILSLGNKRPNHEDELQQSDKIKAAKKLYEQQQAEREMEKNPSDVVIGNKRFKLYEKKKLNYEKAKKFCKSKEGQLAKAMNIDEMRRLQTLLMKARMVSTGLWVGVEKKEWKKHSMKMSGRNPLGENFAGEGMSAMMMGGGPTEMCPVLSSSTRSLLPENCRYEMPFICEFKVGKDDKDDKSKKKEEKQNSKSNTKNSKNQKDQKGQKQPQKGSKAKPKNPPARKPEKIPKQPNAKPKGKLYPKSNIKPTTRPQKKKTNPSRKVEPERIKMGDFTPQNKAQRHQKLRNKMELKK